MSPRKLAQLLRRLGATFPRLAGRRPARRAQHQLVEIARALSVKARLMIMDEPTSSLTQTENGRLYEVIDDLKAEGISGRPLRTGCPRSAASPIGRRVARRVARPVNRSRPRSPTTPWSADGRPRLARRATGAGTSSPGTQVSSRSERSQFDLRAAAPIIPLSFRLEAAKKTFGGMAGLVGAGRTELAEALFGIGPILGARTGNRWPRRRASPPGADAVAPAFFSCPRTARSRPGASASQSVDNLALPNSDSESPEGFVGSNRRLTRHRKCNSGPVLSVRARRPRPSSARCRAATSKKWCSPSGSPCSRR